MNRDWAWIISIILFGISVWLDYIYDDKRLALLVVAFGVIVIIETCFLGTHGK